MLLPWNTRPDEKPPAEDSANGADEKHSKDTTFLINKQAQCFIRREAVGVTPGKADSSGLPGAEMKHPIKPEAGNSLLGGGAIWGFESENVFDAVMTRDNPAEPQVFPRSDAKTTIVSDLVFSSHGGWGKVTAPFDLRKSKIYANVSMGRAFVYEVERIGRIGCFWNRAKHVIVYERTVVPSLQMAGHQNPHVGRPMLRKVREYVEILEDVRSYPDKAGEKPQIAATGFEKSVLQPCIQEFITGPGHHVYMFAHWSSRL